MKQSTTFAQVATNLLNVLQGYTKGIRFLLVIFLTLTVTTNAWSAEGDKHIFTDVKFEKLLNNSAKISDVTILDPGYPVKTIIVNCRYNKTAGGVTISIKIGGKTFASSKTHNSSSTVDIEFTDEAMQGDIVFSFVNNCGSGTGKGTFYFNSVTLVEAAPAAPCTVTFHTTATTEKEIEEASAGAGVTPPTMEKECGDWTFQGWSESSSNSETSTTPLSLVTLTSGKYYPTKDIDLYPVYTKTTSTGGTAFDKYIQVALGGTITSGKYLISTGSYTMAGNGKNGASFSPETTEKTAYEYTVTVDGSYFTILGPDGKYVGGNDGTSLAFGTTVANDSYRWKYVNSGIQNKSYTTRHIKAYNTTDFRHYATSNGTLTYLYKRTEKSSGSTYYYSYPQCATQTVVTLNPNEGTGGTTSVTAIYEQPMPEITVPTRVGYDFQGYFTENGGAGTKYYNADGTSAKDWDKENATFTLYAYWIAKTYTVTLDNQGATTAGATSVTATYNAAMPSIASNLPEKTGYTFNGYFDATSGGTKYYNADGTSAKNWDKTANTTLYAQWTSNKTATSLSWSAATYSATIDADNTFPELTKSPADLTGITYSSLDETVATIDANGNITLLKKGETTITATFEETPTHTGATASYTLTVNPSNCRWVEVEIGDITYGDDVLITVHGTDASGDAILNMLQDPHAATNPTIRTIKVIDLLNGTDVPTTVIWNIRKRDDNQDHFTIYRNGSTTARLAFVSGYDIRVGSSTSGSVDSIFTITTEGYLQSTQTSHNMRMSSSNDWRHYATAGQTLKFYKRECLDATSYWVEGNFTNVTCYTQLPQQLAKDGSITLTFTAADGYELPNTVTVDNATKTWDKTNGKLTISNPTDNVMVTVEAVELHTITWMVGGSELTTGSQTTSVENGKKITAIPANPNDNTLEDCGATKFMGWSTDNIGSTPDADAPTDLFTTVAEAQSKIGGITENKTFYAVFATAEETDGGTVDATLSFASTAQRTSLTNDKAVWQQNNITLTNTKGTEQNAANCTTYVNPVRFYKYSKIKVEHTSNEISKILFTCNTSAYATVLNTSIGTSNNVTVEVNDKEVVVTFNSPVEAFEVKLTDQVRMDALTITAGGGTITTYSNYVTNCCATPVPTNGSYTSPSGTSVTLTWDGESTRYHITCANPIIDDHTESTSYEVSSLTECEEYTFYVSAYPEEGCESEAITITAQPFSGSKTVTFNYNGNGQANTTSSTSCGNTSITLPTPTWAGYRFMGWYTAANGGDKVNENPYTPTSNITLYAQWEKEYNVTYNANGGSTTCAGGAYIAGETVTVCTTNPSKTGHTFTGWTYSPSVTITDGKFVMPASNVTITAQWQVESYTVTWNPNGGNWGGSTANIVETYEYGATIVQPAAPQRDGYRFTGWNATVASTMPATNITYTAQWKQNYTITFHDGDDVTPWTQTKDAESINLTEYLGTLACDDYQFAGWSTDATKYDDEPANITTWVTGNYTPTANIDLYAVYTKGAVTNDFTLNCAGGVYEIWVNNSAKNHMAGQRNDSYNLFTKEYWDSNKTGSNGAPFTITKIAENTYTIQNAEGHYIAKHSNDTKLDIESEWQNLDRYKWTVSAGTNGSWRFTNKAVTTHALIYYNNYFRLYTATSVTNGSTSYYDLELTPAASNVYQSNPNCGPYYIRFETHGGEFIQGEYAYGEEQTGLTETTYSKFPAAELEGYTFAGWKDGSPIDDEITADNASDAPYLKQAGEDLVVSSNKTYHAVYYYYDEEEDIDFSKEFTTSIYAEVNGMKYFLAGTPSSGTMSSTTDCGYVSEVTITPGTEANAGKYKITVNGVAMAPKANETDLLNGTYWWTITERSVGSGEYKISGQDKKNIVLFNSSWGHYSYNQGSEYGNNYYYPRFGKCLQHHWTSNPTLKPSLNLSGDVYVTATNARGIMATSTLKVSAQQLNANEQVNITSNSNDVYFSADCTVNFVKADKPTNTLTITASPSGVIEQDIYVHYKPSAEGNGTPASVVVSANLATPNPSVTDDQTIYVRNLPAKFVIATKVGTTWYALPADMSSATNPLGVVIEVDETTMTTIAPNTTTYTLWPVKTTATENDRYTNVTGVAYGDRVRFAAVNYEQRGLWANNNNNVSTIRNHAVIDALGDDGLAGYEWKITTTVVDGHWQYTLQTDQDKNQNFLRYWTAASGGAKWGTYANGENDLYFLPVTEVEPFEMQVVEWYPTKVLVQTEATLATVSATIGGEEVAEPVVTQKGGKLYEISNLPLETNPTKLLAISYTADEITYANNTVIPIIISRAEKNIADEPFATLTADVYNSADLVVRDGAVLTVNGTEKANTFANVTIYPTAKISVPAMNENGANNKLSVNSLTFFGGIDEIYDGSTYTINKYGVPELSLKGLLNKTITQMDYIMRVNLDQMYSLTVPYDVQLADIKYWDGSDIALGSALYVSAYDGEARANLDMSNTWRWEVNFAEKVLKAGVGYTISAELQAGVGSEYSILRMPMMSNVASGATEAAKTVAVTAWGKDANVTDNHKGWNLVGNPYMTTIQGADDADLVLGYLKETGTGPWEWVEKTYRYVTIPSDDGTYYWQPKFTDAVLPPFKNFFVQVGTTGELVFDLGTRQSMPARSTQAAIEKEVEFEILMSNATRQDNTGLLISEGYSPAYEINADLEKMTGSMSVYTIFGGYKLAYNALSPINASEWIPMGYIAPAAGEYTFRLDDIDKIVEQVEHVYLIDYDANNIVDLMDDEYEFTTDKEQNNNRFAINVVLIQDKDNTTTGLDIINGNVAAPIKFIYHDKMYIQSGGVIYDGTGKQVTNINK